MKAKQQKQACSPCPTTTTEPTGNLQCLPFLVEQDDGSEVRPQRLPPRVRKVVAYLDAMPDGKALQTFTLGERTNLPSIDGIRTHPALRDYRFAFNGRLYWGNKNTIEKARTL